jgi:two-component system response regulator WspF
MRLGIVNDLPMAVEALRRALVHAPQHQVAWTAADGAEAVAACKADTPDLVLMDLIMPGMDGVEATRRIMAESPCAVLVVTASIGANTSRVFEAMGHGALDAVDTPALGGDVTAEAAAGLLRKINTIGKLIARPRARLPTAPVLAPRTRGQPLVAIGASSGGPAALATVLGGLPATLQAGIVIVQHIDAQFAPGMADWLCQFSPWPVRVAIEGERPAPGVVLLAGTTDHLVLHEGERLGYSREPAAAVHRPSVDVFFDSANRHWRGDLVGVLLTGMGRDGAAGLKGLRDKGHFTIAQDAASSAVYGMPKAAADIKAAVQVLPVDAIAGQVAFRVATVAGAPLHHDARDTVAPLHSTGRTPDA